MRMKWRTIDFCSSYSISSVSIEILEDIRVLSIAFNKYCSRDKVVGRKHSSMTTIGHDRRAIVDVIVKDDCASYRIVNTSRNTTRVVYHKKATYTTRPLVFYGLSFLFFVTSQVFCVGIGCVNYPPTSIDYSPELPSTMGWTLYECTVLESPSVCNKEPPSGYWGEKGRKRR